MAIGEDACQCQGKLLGRPAMAQKVTHQAEQDAIWMELDRRAALPASSLGASTRYGAGVACGLCVAPQLAADGAGGAPQDLGHGAILLMYQAGQRHAVFRLELLIALGWGALHLRTLLGGRCCTSLLNPPPSICRSCFPAVRPSFFTTDSQERDQPWKKIAAW